MKRLMKPQLIRKLFRQNRQVEAPLHARVYILSQQRAKSRNSSTILTSLYLYRTAQLHSPMYSKNRKLSRQRTYQQTDSASRSAQLLGLAVFIATAFGRRPILSLMALQQRRVRHSHLRADAHPRVSGRANVAAWCSSTEVHQRGAAVGPIRAKRIRNRLTVAKRYLYYAETG
jgi:hypothetical protein